MGSMIGSGIFILPGVAFIEVGNKSVVLAFLVGGLLTIPAALSAAELATAIPESGGSYTYIQRGMGPVMGTVAGVGNWMVLNFKTALALIGGLPYLIYIFPNITSIGPQWLDIIIALSVGLTIFFTVINAVSSDSAGKAQNIIVVIMMIALGVIIVASGPDVASSNPGGVVDVGAGFLTATSLVFVAYAGVIKVTSVAEEIKQPDRNIPLGIIISLALTTIIYVAITYIAVVTADIPNLVENVPVSDGGLAPNGEGAILAIAAENILGSIGAIMIVGAALLALASTANSGILSASRYPLAMARDGLASKSLAKVNPDTGTPVVSVMATGVAVIFMVVFLPVDRVAQFGAAFQIVVFMLVSLAVIGFRETNPDEYEPSYLSPLYPYLHIFGVVSGFVLITQLGITAIFGTAAITGLAVGYYYFYARRKYQTEGSVKTVLRSDMMTASENQTISMLNRGGEYRALIALRNSSVKEGEHNLIGIVETLRRHNLDVKIDIVEFEKARKESFSASHPEVNATDPPWVAEKEDVTYQLVRSRNVKEAVVEYAAYNGIDVIAHDFPEDTGRIGVVESGLEWIVENAPCDTISLRGGKLGTVDKVAVVSEGPVSFPTKILFADAIAASHTAPVEFVSLIEEDSSELREEVENYLDAVTTEMLSATSVTIIETNDPVEEGLKRSRDADVLLTELDIDTYLRRLLPSPAVRIGMESDTETLFVYSDKLYQYQTIYQRILVQYIFRGLR